MRAQLRKLLHHSLSSSTRGTYSTGFRQFTSFCAHHNVPSLPATKLTVTLFAVSLSTRLTPSTIRVYIAAIGATHREHALPDPTRHNTQLSLVLRAIRRSILPAQSKPRKPITPELLHRMIHYLNHLRSLRGHDRRMLTAAFTLAFHGFLRVGEFTMPPTTRFNPRYHPSTSHVALHRKFFTLVIPRSKTDQFHRGHTIRLDQTTPSSICPVKHMKAYITPLPSTPRPLFTFSGGRPLTRRRCLRYLRQSLKHCGYDPSQYNTHSFRIGAATTAAREGATVSTIQRLGRWRSNAVHTYIRL